MDEEKIVLKLENLAKEFGEVSALAGVSLAVHAGEIVAVRGPSGAGKSTLLLLIAGLLSPDRGEVLVAGRNPWKLGGGERTRLRRDEIGMVFQDARLLPYLNIRENILAAGGDAGRAMELVRELGLSDRVNHLPKELSAGEQQRVGLARALLSKPRLLLADEPTGNLDEGNTEVVLKTMRDFAKTGGAVLVVTHDPVVIGAADRTVILEKGLLL
jgi:ABC-type lipoprotein export system ATPase subunit